MKLPTEPQSQKLVEMQENTVVYQHNTPFSININIQNNFYEKFDLHFFYDDRVISGLTVCLSSWEDYFYTKIKNVVSIIFCFYYEVGEKYIISC